MGDAMLNTMEQTGTSMMFRFDKIVAEGAEGDFNAGQINGAVVGPSVAGTRVPLTQKARQVMEEDQMFLLSAEQQKNRSCWSKCRSGYGNVFSSHNLFWTEKLMLLVDFIQIFALMWTWNWPWPFFFLKWTQPIVFVNVDLVAYRSTDLSSYISDWQSTAIAGLPLFVLIWCVIPFIPIVLFGIWKILRLPSRHLMERFIVWLLQFLYLPTAIVLLKYGVCQSDGAFNFQCKISCGANDANCSFLRVVIPGAVGAVFLLGFPFGLMLLIKRQIIYTGSKEHLKYVESKEAELLLKVNNSWNRRHLHLFSSFRRPMVYQKSFNMLWRLSFVAAACGLSFSSTTASLVFMILLGAPLFFFLLSPPYRMASTNFLVQIFGWILVIDALLGYLVASGIRSPLLVDSVLTVWLAFFNGIGIVFFLALSVFWALKEDNWPMTKKKVQKLTKGFEHFLKAIYKATKLLEKVRTQLPMFVRVDRLKFMINEVQNSVKQARFENHPLERTLSILQEELEIQHFKSKEKTLLPNPRLEAALSGFRQRMDIRQKELCLVSKRNRRILLKLLAVRFFTGGLQARKKRVLLERAEALAQHSDEEEGPSEAMTARRMEHVALVEEDSMLSSRMSTARFGYASARLPNQSERTRLEQELDDELEESGNYFGGALVGDAGSSGRQPFVRANVASSSRRRTTASSSAGSPHS